MLQPSISRILKNFFPLYIVLAFLISLTVSQERPRTLYNLPPLPDEEIHYTFNSPPPSTASPPKKQPLNNNIPPQQLPFFHQPLGPLFQLPLPQVPLFDRYNDANMKSELPPLPESSLNGFYDSDGMFVPNQPKEVEHNKTHHLLSKNQMAAAATFVSTKEDQSHSVDDDIPQEIFPEPIKKNENNHEKDSIERDFIVSKSNLFVDGFGGQNDDKNEEIKRPREDVVSHVSPKLIEDHGDLSQPKTEVKIKGGNGNNNGNNSDRSVIPPSSTSITIAPIGLEEQFQNTFVSPAQRPHHGGRTSPMTQQFIRTTLSPKLTIRNQNQEFHPQVINQNTGSRVIPNFRKHSFHSTKNNNNNIHIRNNAFMKKRPSPTQQPQFDLPMPTGNDSKKNNNNFQVIGGDNISGKGTSIQQPTSRKGLANTFSITPSRNNRNKINEEIVKNRQNIKINLSPIPPVDNPSIPNEKNPADKGKKKSKIPGKLDLPSLISLPTPLVNRLGNGEEQRSGNFIRNGAVSQQQRSHIPKTVIRTSQIDIRNPTDSMFTNDVDWFDWEMYQNGRSLGFLPPNLVSDPLLANSGVSNNNGNGGQRFNPAPVAVNPSNHFSGPSMWRNIPNQQPHQQQQQHSRASGAQQLPVEVPAADLDISSDEFVLTNPPQLELNLPGYGKQTPLPQVQTSNVYPNSAEKLIPFENTNTGRVPTSQLTTGTPFNNYNNGNNNRNNNNNNYNNNYNNNNYNRNWNNNNNNNNYNNNYNRNYYQSQNNQQPSLLNLFNMNPFNGFNLFG